jgi:hypothetical protein
MTVVNLAPASAGNSATIINAKAELATINILAATASSPKFDTSGNVTVNYASGAKANTTVNIGGADDYTMGALTISNASTITIQSKDKNATISGAQTFADATELTYIAKDGTLTATAANVIANKVETLTFTADGKDLQVDKQANSFNKLSVLNVTATGALAKVYARVSPSSGDVTISEVNVKGTNATSQLDVKVHGNLNAATDAFTISTVNFEVNGTSGTQKLTIVTNSNTPTIAALNVKVAENATATVVLNESGTAAGYTIQGGVFEGKGNITIEGDGTNTDKIDLSNIDRSTLASNSTLTIKLNANGTVVGTNGKDTIDVTTGNVIIQFADSAAANGQDSITGFVGGATADRLKVGAFLGTVSTLNTAANAANGDLDLAAGSNNVGYLFNVPGGTLSASKVVIGSTPANGEVILNDNGKAVVLVSSVGGNGDLSFNNTFNVYYVYDADNAVGTTNFQVELVGTVTVGTSGTTAQNLLLSVIQ